MSDETPNREPIADAVARNSAIVLSLPSGGLLRHHKSRFLAEVPEGIWVESVADERALVDELAGSQKPVGVSFKTGTQKVIFTSPILRREPAYQVNADTVVEALLIPRPANVQVTQRRNNYRVRVPLDSGISVKLWRIAERAYLGDRPSATMVVTAQLQNLSLGGAGVLLAGQDGQPPRLSMDQRLRVELTSGDSALLLEGRLCHVGPPQGAKCHGGIKFQGLQETLEGRQNLAQLTRIVGLLQREEARRARFA